MPRQRITAPEHDRVRSLGWLATWWFETFCVHGPGDVMGDPVRLDDELTGLTLDCYALDLAGRRMYDSALYSAPKGTDKSGQAARFALFEALGPCRFAGWADGGETYSLLGQTYVYTPGEPMGTRVRYPFVRCMATEEGQTGHVYDAVFHNLKHGPLSELPGVDVGLTRTVLSDGGEIIPSTASASSKDGGKETFAAFDEALALDTPLPTPTGWTTMGSVKVGDQLIGLNGRPVKVTGLTEVQHGRACYRVTFRDGSSVVASDGHLWLTKPQSSAAKPKIRTTGQIADDPRTIAVPPCEPWVLPDAALDIDPYVLGAWLGDGDARNATISSSHGDVDELAGLIEGAGYTTRRCAATRVPILYVSVPGAHRNRFSPVKGLKVRLRDAGLIANKHIPDQYLRASQDQRLALLRGLMDTDGSVTDNGNCTWVQTSERLVDQFRQLLLTLGEASSKCWVSDVRSRAGGYWKVHFTPIHVVPFALKRKADRVRMRRARWNCIVSVEPVRSVPVRCVAVDSTDRLFLAGTGCVVTHNCHLYVTPELRRMHATVRRNLAKRKAAEPWSFEPTTMYAPGEGSVAEDAHLLAQALREGRAKARLFFDHRQAPDGCDYSSDVRLRKSLRESYGAAADWMDLDRLVAEFRDPRNTEADLRRYFLNQPHRTASSWIPVGSWEACAGGSVADGDDVVLALDGSFNNDSTVVIGCTVPRGDSAAHLFVVGLWERPLDQPHWRVSVGDVEESIRSAALRWRVLEVTADPYRWQRSLEALAAEGLPVTEFPQSAARMTPATTELYAAIREQRVSHDGDEGLARHMYNAVLHEDSRGKRLRKDTRDSPRKIDAAVTAVMAHNRASWHAAASYDVADSIY